MYFEGAFFCYYISKKGMRNMINNNYGYPYGAYSNTAMPTVPTMIKDAPLSIVNVSGIEGAKAYPMLPNKTVPLFDNSADILYIKSTDGAGYPTITVFDIAKHIEKANPSVEYVTRAEFEELKGMLNNELDKSNTSTASTSAKNKSASDK